MIGKLIQQTADYRAFIPDSFPGSLDYTPSVSTSLANVGASLAIGKLDGLTQLVPNIDFFTLMYNRKEAALSSNIEGTQATMHDFLKVQAEIREGVPTDVADIHCYLQALAHGIDQLDRLPLASRLIQEMHAHLMAGPGDAGKTPGRFRTSQNWIGGISLKTASFVPPPPSELNRCLKDFDNFINDQTGPYPPLVKIALAHAQFETIHPFLDGNGRIGRLIVTLQLCNDKLLERPVFYVSEYLRRHRRTYFDKLDGYRHGLIDDWVSFFLAGVEEVARSAIASAKQLVELQLNDRGRVNALGRQSRAGVSLLEHLYQRPIVNVAQAAEATQLSRQATYGLVKKFVDCGILKPLNPESKRGVELVHQEYVDIFLG